MTHSDLVEIGKKWLARPHHKLGFGSSGFIFAELHSYSGEIPDVIGFTMDCSILIECKVSRGDFLTDKRKKFRKTPLRGMGNYRYYLCPPDVIKIKDLPKGWGLLYAYPKKVRVIKESGDRDKIGRRRRPFVGPKIAANERPLMYTALRRMNIRGHLDEIYDRSTAPKRG